MARSVAEAAPPLILLLSSTSVQLQEQASWALGNLCSDSKEMRDLVRAAGAIVPLVRLLQSSNPRVVATSAFALTNMARGPKDKHTNEFADAGILPLLPGLVSSQNYEVVIESLWLTAYLTAHDARYVTPELIQCVGSALVPRLSSGEAALVIPSLRVIGNIVCASTPTETAGADAVATNQSFLQAAAALLSSESHAVRKETAWVISNVAGGTREQAQALVAAGFVELLTETLKTAPFEIKKESAYALCNLASTIGAEVLKAVVVNKGVEGFVEVLRIGAAYAPEVAATAISFLEMLLQAFGKEASKAIEEAGGLEAMGMLENSGDYGLYKWSSDLIDQYFEEADEGAMDCGGQGTK